MNGDRVAVVCTPCLGHSRHDDETVFAKSPLADIARCIYAGRETGGCWVMSEATSEVSTHSSQYRVSVCPEGVSAARGGRVLGFLFVLKVQYPASLRLLCSSYGFTALATVHTDESGFSTTFQFYRSRRRPAPVPGAFIQTFYRVPTHLRNKRESEKGRAHARGCRETLCEGSVWRYLRLSC